MKLKINVNNHLDKINFGGLNKEARMYVKHLVQISGGPLGLEIQRIYQIRDLKLLSLIMIISLAMNKDPLWMGD